MYSFFYLAPIILLSRSYFCTETAEKKLNEPNDFKTKIDIQGLPDILSDDENSVNEQDHMIEKPIKVWNDFDAGTDFQHLDLIHSDYEESKKEQDHIKGKTTKQWNGTYHQSYQDIYEPNRFEKFKYAYDFTDKVVLITGSSSGIGAEMARLFSSLGAKVVITGRNVTRLNQVAYDVYRLSPYKLKDDAIPGYGTLKAALIMATQTLALELAPNVRVNSISPGVVIGTLLYGPNDITPKDKARVKKLAPLARNEVPLDVAKGAVFLASCNAEFITGHNLVIDGGINMNYPGNRDRF